MNLAHPCNYESEKILFSDFAIIFTALLYCFGEVINCLSQSIAHTFYSSSALGSQFKVLDIH